MPKVIFVDPLGARTEVQTDAGRTLMAVAVRNNIAGVLAECGGACQCGTCHVYVDDAWLRKLPAPSLAEDAMLENTAVERADNSRLACQVRVEDELDGLVVRTPSSQI